MSAHDLLFAAAGASTPGLSVSSVFTTSLYTGDGSTSGKAITNGIDLATFGGLVIVKGRNNTNWGLWDTVRGAGTGSSSTTNRTLSTSATSAQGLSSTTDYLSSFNSNGFTVSASAASGSNRVANFSGTNYASWTFRKQAKFFDVVQYTGTGTNRTVAHNLGAVPGCIIVKRVDAAANWIVYHRSLGNNAYIALNTATSVVNGSSVWNTTTPTASVFSLGTPSTVNTSGATYIAYLFAHDAGGFGNNSSESVISCGTFATDSSGASTVNLGWSPQFLLAKSTTTGSSGYVLDTTRTWSASNDQWLAAESNGSETSSPLSDPTATGFTFTDNPTDVYIYIAIRAA